MKISLRARKLHGAKDTSLLQFIPEQQDYSLTFTTVATTSNEGVPVLTVLQHESGRLYIVTSSTAGDFDAASDRQPDEVEDRNVILSGDGHVGDRPIRCRQDTFRAAAAGRRSSLIPGPARPQAPGCSVIARAESW